MHFFNLSFFVASHFTWCVITLFCFLELNYFRTMFFRFCGFI